MLIHKWPRAARPALWVWRRTLPEDPYLPTWLSRHALVRGEIRAAEAWYAYSVCFAGTNRTIDYLDHLVRLVLMDDPQVPDLAKLLAEHLDWLEARGMALVST